MANEVSRPVVKSVRQVEPLENLIETVWLSTVRDIDGFGYADGHVA